VPFVTGASLGTVLPQKLLQFLGIEAIRNPTKIHYDKTGLRQKPAFIEDFSAPAQI
jgi:hypothetical protein